MEVFFKEIENQKNFQIFDENHGLAPLQKWTLPTMLKLYLWSQESLFSHLEQYYTSCLGIFQRKWDSKKLSNSWWKLWVNPFAKMDIVPLCWSDVFEVKKVFFFPFRTLCLGLFQRKWDSDELSNCSRKSWVDSFGKVDIFPMFLIYIFFSLVSVFPLGKIEIFPFC